MFFSASARPSQLLFYSLQISYLSYYQALISKNIATPLIAVFCKNACVIHLFIHIFAIELIKIC